MVSRPASMRLAMAISPSRDSSSTAAHLAQVHAHRVVRAVIGRRLVAGDDRLVVLADGDFAAFRVSASSSASTTLTPISLSMARVSSMASDVTSSDGRTLFSSSIVT